MIADEIQKVTDSIIGASRHLDDGLAHIKEDLKEAIHASEKHICKVVYVHELGYLNQVCGMVSTFIIGLVIGYFVGVWSS